MRLFNHFLTFLSLCLFSYAASAAPSLMILKNQFGEQSNNDVIGSYMPIVPGSSNIVAFSGSGAPTNGTSGSGHGAAAPGSLYIRTSNGDLFVNTNTKASPTWSQIGTGAGPVLSTALAGFVSGAGSVTSADTVLSAFDKLDGNVGQLQNGTLTPQSEAISGAGAVSTTKMLSTITNAGSTYAVTLAAPSSQDGQIKVIKAITAMTGTVTLAMTNIKGPGYVTLSGTTTLTFTNVGDAAIFMAVGGKWMLIGGNAVAS